MSDLNKKEQQLKDQTIDALFRYAQEVRNEKIYEELSKREPVEFSDRHKKQMEQLFKSVDKKPAVFYMRRAAAVIVVCFLLAGVSVMSVDAWRVKFFNLFTKTSQTNTEVRFGEEEQKANTYSTENVTLNYIPEGMRVTEKNQKNELVMLTFTKDELSFKLRVTRSNYTSFIDTENKDAEEVMINDFKGFLRATNTNEFNLKWSSEEYVYTLSGNLDKETLIKIAENIN